jgi:hypothetical protein
MAVSSDSLMCIFQSPLQHREKEAGQSGQSFSGLKSGFSIEYSNEVQLRLLQLFSERATQTFTYYCKNSLAWYDEMYKDKKRAIVLEGADKTKHMTKKFDNVIDGCKVSRKTC